MEDCAVPVVPATFRHDHQEGKMLRCAVSIAALFVLSGCASTAKWQHPQRAGEGFDGMTMALADCESYAAGRTPMPQLQGYMPVPAPSSYNTTGTITTYGGYSTFQGRTTASGGFASGYAQGANMGASIANAYALGAAKRREEELTHACMRTTGWIDTSTPEGEAKFKQAVAESAAKKSAPKESSSEASQWEIAIRTLIDTEAARPGGIDYAGDISKQKAFDGYVAQLSKIPGNENKPANWFVIEAHKLVLRDSAQPAK